MRLLYHDSKITREGKKSRINEGDFEKGNDEKEERLKERGVKKKKRNEKGEKRLESVNGHSILR